MYLSWLQAETSLPHWSYLDCGKMCFTGKVPQIMGSDTDITLTSTLMLL